MGNHPLHINIPITKIDEEQRKVWGYATVEEVDAHGEIISYDASKKAFSGWLGNIREMHSPVAIGKAIEVRFDDDKKGVWLGAYISKSADGENAWTKVKEGVLQAYSIGGNVKDFKMVKVNGEDHLMVTAYELGETSLVDNPACPSAMLEVVKSANGGLIKSEKMQRRIVQPATWWEKQFLYSPTQRINKTRVLIYNKSSMSKRSDGLAKDIFSAGQLVDLGMCLADFIWFSRWEGKNTADLEAALESIKTAATTELGEDENFPDPVTKAIEEACSALNITKVEELKKMAEEKADLQRTNVQAGTERNAEAEVVQGPAEATPAVTPPAPAPAPAVTVNKPEGEVQSPDGQPVATPGADPAAPADQPTAAVTPQPESTSTTPAPAAAAATTPVPAAPEGAAAAVQNAAPGDPITSPTEDALSKSIEAAVAKAVTPLQQEIAQLKAQPAASKRAPSYTDVDKVAPGAGDAEQNQHKARFDALMEKAKDYGAHPERGSMKDRIEIGVELRKLSRLMDPESRAKHAQVRATFQQMR